MRSYSALLLLVACFCATRVVAVVQLAAPFNDHAVLQRDKVIRIWGAATPGETISVSFDAETQHTAASADGRWAVIFPARSANPIGQELTVAGENTIVVKDVLIGEVWLCSGQSNMTFPLVRSEGGGHAIATANLPLLRQFAVMQTPASEPATTVQGAWRVCSPASAGRFTAVGFYFARELLEDLRIPIGIVNCAWGGTPIESWVSSDVLKGQPAFAVVMQRWQQNLVSWPVNEAAYQTLLQPWLDGEAAAKRNGDQARQDYVAAHPRPVLPANIRPSSAPASLYNGMLHPLLPYSLRGVIWYQGEANTGRPDEYAALFAALIASWRLDFKQGDFPFYWVNLANFKGDQKSLGFAKLREAQTQTLQLAQTGQAIAIDVGNPDDIHPTNKQAIGHRLALIAKSEVYGLSGEFSGPRFSSVTVHGSVMHVRLSHAAGLCARGGPPQALEVAGIDRKFHPATGIIDGETLLVSAPEVPAPVAVRYAFTNSPDANLYNGANLPAVPFRSDHW